MRGSRHLLHFTVCWIMGHCALKELRWQFLFQKLKDVELQRKGAKPTKCQQTINYTLWLVSTSRNAIVVILCSTVAYVYENLGPGSPFRLTGRVKSGFPDLQWPPFGTVVQNSTKTFPDMLGDLGSSVILVPVIGVLGNVAIAKAFGETRGSFLWVSGANCCFSGRRHH